MLVIPALGRLQQENNEFKVSLGYIVRPCLKKIYQNVSIYPKQCQFTLKNRKTLKIII
jgi:hypothetical protein